jgi:hypothetical protein
VGLSFEQIVVNDKVLIGSPETVAKAILRITGQLDLVGLALIFKLGPMPYGIFERSMTRFGPEVVPRIRNLVHLILHAWASTPVIEEISSAAIPSMTRRPDQSIIRSTRLRAARRQPSIAPLDALRAPKRVSPP